MYSQRNPLWHDKYLGFGITTIGKYGCVITSFGNGLGVTPLVVNEALKRVNGYASSNKNLVIWRKVAEAFSELTFKSLVHCVTVPAPVDKIDESLRNNDLVLIRVDSNLVKSGIQQHWLLVLGGNGKDGYDVHDPWVLSDGQLLLPPAYSKKGWNAARAISAVVIYSRQEITMSNLLTNSSWENGWYHPDGIGELQIPNSWIFKYANENVENPIDPSKWSRPEVRTLPRKDLPAHEQALFILDGEYTLKIFKGSGSFLCGLSQNLELQPGRYLLTVQVFADLIKDYEDNGDKIWADDPSGQDGMIRFSGWTNVTGWDSLTPGKWNTKTFEFDTSTLPGGITIEFMCPFPLRNSGLFCDAWTLEQIDEKSERGQPRIQYERTYNVIPENATFEQAIAIFKGGWKEGRQTAGGSYDDAGIGNLEKRLAKLFSIPIERQVEFRRFFNIYYPNVVVDFLPMPGESPPPPPPPPPIEPLGELITLHLQTPVKGWWDYINEAKTEWVKTVGNFELVPPPDTKLLIRQYLSANDQQKYLDNFHYVENGEDKYWDAGHFLDRFWDSVVANAPRINAVEGLNETIATGDMPGIEKAVRFEVAFADELVARCKKASIEWIVPCLLNTAVGNPQHGYEVEKLLPAARAAVKYGGYIGYHSYFPCHAIYAEQWVENEGIHHHERAIYSWDPVFAKHGLAPRYLFTEAGAIGMGARLDGRPDAYDPDAGWRASIDAERYAKLLVMVRNRLNNWNLSHGNRVGSMMIFTSGEGVGWKSFQLKDPQMKILLRIL